MTDGALAPIDRANLVACRDVIGKHSRTFALASTLLGREARDHAAAVYAWCRAADDAIDLAPAGEHTDALARLRAELADLYAGVTTTVAGRGFAVVVRARRIPVAYPQALLDGMAMDVADTRYRTDDDLITYCYRVAGVVGLMMCHVLGLSDQRALVPAVHLGIAMQLTNIVRDVGEDWVLGRMYLPEECLLRHGVGDVAHGLGRPMPHSARTGVHAARLELLQQADRYYRSAATGYRALPGRAAAAIHTAARVYRAIGTEVRTRGISTLEQRAVVGRVRKVGHVATAIAIGAAGVPGRVLTRVRGRRPTVPTTIVELADVPRL